MPSPTIDRHRRIANVTDGHAGYTQGAARLAMETVAEIMTYREALFRCAPSHQGGHSDTGKAIADALGCTFPLAVPELEAKAKDEKMDPAVLWPWLTRLRGDVEFRREHLQELPDREAEIKRALGFLIEKRGESTSDAMTGCTSYVQRRLQCGYNRAARLLEEMAERGMITEPDQNGARRLLTAGECG